VRPKQKSDLWSEARLSVGRETAVLSKRTGLLSSADFLCQSSRTVMCSPELTPNPPMSSALASACWLKGGLVLA
jgi:hypothetical protein